MEDKIINLLKEADLTAGPPVPVSANLSATVRHRANRRHFISLASPLVAAAMLLMASGIWLIAIRTPKTTQEQEKIAQLEAQIKELQVRTNATLNLLKDVLDEEQKKEQLDELEAQLASIPDPLEEIQKQVDKTAFILLYQADRMYRELNQTDSAVETYNRIIELFPRNRWAVVARQRLSEINNRKFNKIVPKGELKWKPQKALSSC